MTRPFRLRKNRPKNLKEPLKHLEVSKYKSKEAPSSLIVYDPKIKPLVNYTRGIGRKGSKDYIPSSMEVIYSFFKSFGGEGKVSALPLSLRKNMVLNEKEHSYIDPKKRFKVEIVDPFSVNHSLNTFSAFKLTIRKNGKNKVLYIKSTKDNLSYRNAAQEMILLKLLEKNGISTIKPRFAFSKTHINRGVHFIAYDFTSLKNVEQAYLNKLINKEELKQIQNKLTNISEQFVVKDSIMILDIQPKNCFYRRLPNGEIKLFLTDVYSEHFRMLNDSYSDSTVKKTRELLRFAKKEGIVK